MSETLVVKLATMNGALLKDLPLDEVLSLHPLLDPNQFTWRKAQKTKPIKAKPISAILNDQSVTAKIVLATLEGHEAVRANGFVCWGVENDIWQQKEQNLHGKYKPVHVDPDGWVHFEPLPDVACDAYQVVADQHNLGPCGGFSVINPSWGDERQIDGKSVWLQYGVANDWVLRGIDPSQPDDFYRVARKFFDNTYSLI